MKLFLFCSDFTNEHFIPCRNRDANYNGVSLHLNKYPDGGKWEQELILSLASNAREFSDNDGKSEGANNEIK